MKLEDIVSMKMSDEFQSKEALEQEKSKTRHLLEQLRVSREEMDRVLLRTEQLERNLRIVTKEKEDLQWRLDQALAENKLLEQDLLQSRTELQRAILGMANSRLSSKDREELRITTTEDSRRQDKYSESLSRLNSLLKKVSLKEEQARSHPVIPLTLFRTPIWKGDCGSLLMIAGKNIGTPCVPIISCLIQRINPDHHSRPMWKIYSTFPSSLLENHFHLRK